MEGEDVSSMYSVLLRYGAAVSAVGIALLLKKCLDSFIGDENPFLLFFVAVMAAGWLGGQGAGLLATVLATVASDYFFLTPGWFFPQNSIEQNLQLGLFFLEGTLISWGAGTLRRVVEACKEADRRKDDFLALLAHELRNPLAALSYTAQLIRLGIPADPAMQRVAEGVEDQVKQMVHLVEDLLDVSRISHGKLKLQKERIDLSTVVDHAVEVSRPLIDARKQTLKVLLSPEPVHLVADPTRLKQILVNLLNNAAKYTEDGGHIWLTVERCESEVVIRVRDTGKGIAVEMLPRVFDRFVQADGSSNCSQGGLGIGLWLTRHLVQMHGGTVQALSEGIGKGSEFVVRLAVLPRAHQKDAAQHTEVTLS
jgi:signal transduction histidine kinase